MTVFKHAFNLLHFDAFRDTQVQYVWITMNVICFANLCDMLDATPFSDPTIAPAPSYPCPLQSSIDSPRLLISFKIVFNSCSPARPVLQCINFTKLSFTRKFESKYLKARDICSLLMTSEVSSARILKKLWLLYFSNYFTFDFVSYNIYNLILYSLWPVCCIFWYILYYTFKITVASFMY